MQEPTDEHDLMQAIFGSVARFGLRNHYSLGLPTLNARDSDYDSVALMPRMHCHGPSHESQCTFREALAVSFDMTRMMMIILQCCIFSPVFKFTPHGESECQPE